MSDAPPPDDALALLGDEYARAILTATTEDAMTAASIADLEAAGFLREVPRTEDDGNHYAEYRTALDRLTVDVTPDSFDVDAAFVDRDAAADRLRALWRDVR